jgi:hypothetical protein
VIRPRTRVHKAGPRPSVGGTRPPYDTKKQPLHASSIRTRMSDEQDREVPTFRLRRIYRSEPTLSLDVARGEAASSLEGEEPHTGADRELPPPLSLSHRRSAPTHLSSPQPTREFRGAVTKLRRHPPLRSAVPSTTPREGSMEIEGLSMRLPRSDTPPVPPARPQNRNNDVNETTPSGIPKVESAANMGTNAEKETSCAAKGPESDADAKARGKKERNRVASAKSRRNKRESIAELQGQKAKMEADIEELEDRERRLQEECAVASNELLYVKVFLYELEQHCLGERASGKEERERSRPDLIRGIQKQP